MAVVDDHDTVTRQRWGLEVEGVGYREATGLAGKAGVDQALGHLEALSCEGITLVASLARAERRRQGFAGDGVDPQVAVDLICPRPQVAHVGKRRHERSAGIARLPQEGIAFIPVAVSKLSRALEGGHCASSADQR